RSPRSSRGPRPRVRRDPGARHPHGQHSQRAPGSRGRLLAAIDGALQLRLVHLRAPGDVQPLRLVVELLLRAALRPVRARAKASAAARGDVATRRARGLLRFAAPRPLLVDRTSGDLLRPLGRRALLLRTLLDVLVLTLTLVAPGFLRHATLLSSFGCLPGRFPGTRVFNPCLGPSFLPRAS